MNALLFDLTAACSGFILHFQLRKKMIKSGQYQKGLVIGAEVSYQKSSIGRIEQQLFFGDGAGGVL